jgi:molecular chaperone DnaJ
MRKIEHMSKDLYAVLGISRDASESDIKKAYRRLSKELHPDKHKGDKEKEKKFKEINEAYEILSDSKKKQAYDQFGTTGSGHGFGGSPFEGAHGFHYSGGDFSNLGDLFENFFGGAAASQKTSRDNGQTLEVDVHINFVDVVKGTQKKISLRKKISCESCKASGVSDGSKMISCTECGGTGQVSRTAQSFFGVVQQRGVCEQCRGSGQVPEDSCRYCSGEGRRDDQTEVTVEIPAGIHDGQTLRIRDGGDAGRRGAISGDLYVHVYVTPDARFVRDGDDVRSDVHIPLIDAILGGKMDIETVHGSITLKVPAGTQPHHVFRLKGKGLPVLSSSRHGDHYAKAIIDIPTKLSRAEKKLMEEWRIMRGSG